MQPTANTSKNIDDENQHVEPQNQRIVGQILVTKVFILANFRSLKFYIRVNLDFYSGLESKF